MADFILDAIDVLKDQECSGIAVVVIILVLTLVFVAKVIYVNRTSDLTRDEPGSSRRSMRMRTVTRGLICRRSSQLAGRRLVTTSSCGG